MKRDNVKKLMNRQNIDKRNQQGKLSFEIINL